MTVAEFWGCQHCERELPHDCEAERSLIALALSSELYARRILPKLQTTDFMEPVLRGAFAQLRRKESVLPEGLATPPGLPHFNVWDCEADPLALDRYINTVKARALQRGQINRLAMLTEQVYKAPMLPRDFDWQVLTMAAPVSQPAATPEPLRRVSLVDLVVDPEEEDAA